MSFSALRWALQQNDIPAAAFRVLVHLANRHDPTNGCFPSHECLAADAGCSLSTINEQLRVLENAGKIRRIRRKSRSGHRLTTRYVFGFEAADDKASEAEAETASQVSEIQPRKSGDGGAEPTPEMPSNQPRESGDNPNKDPKKEEEGACARESFDFRIRLLEALGVPDPALAGPWWSSENLEQHRQRWAAHGLISDEIIEAARLSRQKHPRPPDGPKALDGFMARFARRRRSGKGGRTTTERKRIASEAEILLAKAARVNGTENLFPVEFNNGDAWQLLEQGLVTPQRLRDRGLAHLIPDGWAEEKRRSA